MSLSAVCAKAYPSVCGAKMKQLCSRFSNEVARCMGGVVSAVKSALVHGVVGQVVRKARCWRVRGFWCRASEVVKDRADGSDEC